MIIPAISAVTRQVAVYRQQKKHPGPSFEQAKITSAALGLEERAEFDADPGKLSWTSAVPPGTLDAVIIFGRAPIPTSEKQLV